MSYLIYLRSFLGVYRQGSISRAASTLHLTQPAVSQHIKLLEDRLGRKLFERLPRGVAATPAAHELERLAGTHLDALEALTHFRTHAQDALAGTVFVGTTSGLSKRLIASLTEVDCHGIRLNVQSAPPPALVDALAGNKLDLIITPARIPRKGIEYQSIYSGRIVLVCAPAWREQLPKSAAPRGIPLIETQGRAPTLEHYWKTVFGAHPAAPALVVPDVQLALEAAKGGLGLAAVPEGLCRDEIQSGLLMIAHQTKKSPEITLYCAQNRGGDAIERVAFMTELVKRVAAAW